MKEFILVVWKRKGIDDVVTFRVDALDMKKQISAKELKDYAEEPVKEMTYLDWLMEK